MGDPNSRSGQPVQHLTRPIVAGANYIVRCRCGTAVDVKAESADEALAQFDARHRHSGPMPARKASTISYGEHPLYQQVCPVCGDSYLKCECEGGA